MADALAAAHAAGVVHRDLKPSNLMLTTTGHIKVLDFGIAMFASTESETIARLTGAGSAIGTAAYMSPEQAAGDRVDARSDLWSLGAVLQEMLTGRPPFDGANTLAVINAVQTAPIPAIRSLRPDVAQELETDPVAHVGAGSPAADDDSRGSSRSRGVVRGTSLDWRDGRCAGAAREPARAICACGDRARRRRRGRHVVDPAKRERPVGP